MTPFCKIPLASEAARKGKRIMKKFVVKRVLLSIVILFFVSMIIYAIMRCMPVVIRGAAGTDIVTETGSKEL